MHIPNHCICKLPSFTSAYLEFQYFSAICHCLVIILEDYNTEYFDIILLPFGIQFKNISCLDLPVKLNTWSSECIYDKIGYILIRIIIAPTYV